MPGSIRSSTTRSAARRADRASAVSPSPGLDHLVLVGAQVGHDDLPHGRVVVDHEDSGHGHLPAPSRAYERGRPRPARTTSASEREPARPGSRGRAGSGCRRARRTGRAPGPRAASTAPSTTSPTTAGARAATGAAARRRPRSHRAPAGAQHEVVQHHARRQPDRRRRPAGRCPAGSAAARRRTRRRATPSADRATSRTVMTAPRSGRPTWSGARRAGSGAISRPGSRGRAPAARRRARARAGCGRRRRSCPAGWSAGRRPIACSETTSTSLPARRVDQVEQVAHPHAGPRPAGAPALDAGDRQGLGALGHREQLVAGQRAPPGRRTRPRARTPGSSAVAVTPAALADLLIGMPPGPSPERTPKTETLRSNGTVLPAVASTATPRGEPGRAQQPAPRHRALAGSPVGRSYVVSSTSPRQRAADDRQLDRDVHDQGADGDPGDGVVGGAEREGPGVPLRGVRQPGGELEDRGRDQHADRGPLQALDGQRPQLPSAAG